MSERLTIPNYRVVTADGKVMTRRKMLSVSGIKQNAMELYYQLKKYEDICFDDPDEEHSTEIISLDKLQKLVAAYTEGRVVVLPDCKKCKNYAARDALYPQCIGVVYPCEGCVGLIKIKRYPNNKFEAALAGEGAE